MCLVVGGPSVDEAAEISVLPHSLPTEKPLSLPLVWREETEAVPFPQNLLTQSGPLLGGLVVSHLIK